jgi:hypothetical protein
MEQILLLTSMIWIWNNNDFLKGAKQEDIILKDALVGCLLIVNN